MDRMEARPVPAVAAAVPPLPPTSRLALLLDLDGTLLDLAASPEEVSVPPALPAMLGRLSERLGGALAVVSGRTVSSVAALLPGLDLAIAGEHGGAIRRSRERVLERPELPELPEAWRVTAAKLAADHPGVLLEEKPHGFVLHYRKAPGAGPALKSGLAGLVDGMNGEGAAPFVVAPAVMAWEVRPRAVTKATAVRALLGAAPFAGRVPVFVGDDATDEDGIRAAREAGGFGFRVKETFGDTEGVRDWLARLAAGPEEAEEDACRAGS
jgi:trehalose 6-phosphate phosphatase